MSTPHTLVRRVELDSEPSAVSGDGNGSRYRALTGGIFLAVAVLAALVIGGWSLVSSLTVGAPAARIGESVGASGGLVRVDSVTPERMAAMQMQNFAKSGMNMAGPTNMDMAPEGQRRFTVEFTLAAESGSIAYSPEDFQISGEDVKASGPIRTQLGAGTLAEGQAVSGNLVFQAPEKAKDLMLNFDGGRRIALDLPAAEKGGSDGGKAGEGHGH